MYIRLLTYLPTSKTDPSQNTSIFSVIIVNTRQFVSVPARNSSAFSPDVSMKDPVHTTMRQRANSNHLHNRGVAISHITPSIVAEQQVNWEAVFRLFMMRHGY